MSCLIDLVRQLRDSRCCNDDDIIGKELYCAYVDVDFVKGNYSFEYVVAKIREVVIYVIKKGYSSMSFDWSYYPGFYSHHISGSIGLISNDVDEIYRIIKKNIYGMSGYNLKGSLRVFL